MGNSAFAWKKSRPPAGLSALTVPRADDGVRWATLQQAEDVTGVAASTLRNWARKGRVPSKLTDDHGDARKLVDLDGVVSRAQELGRFRQPEPARPSTYSPLSGAAPAPAPIPEGHMLVPLDAWERLLLQLGNLHEAGQQLAEARERAGKAETEVEFLRERVTEMRSERDALLAAKAESEVEAEAEAAFNQPEPTATARIRNFYRELRRRF